MIMVTIGSQASGETGLKIWISGLIAPLNVLERPLAIPTAPDDGLASPYIIGLLVCFALNAALLVVFLTRINRNLRAPQFNF